ncbi:MAG: hypothetical protein OQL06_01135 [Gammaproteobacteria bacterium]|nr:hypothetical protein [Gammaproteobacteria bacterium]
MSAPVAYPRIPKNDEHKIRVKICWYKKHSEAQMGEEILDELTLHDLQDIFDVYINNALYNCWHVKTRHARALQRMTQHRIAIKNYSYFVEQEAHYGDAAND